MLLLLGVIDYGCTRNLIYFPNSILITFLYKFKKNVWWEALGIAQNFYFISGY